MKSANLTKIRHYNLNQITQHGLNCILNVNLDEDGDIGRYTKEQIKVFIDKIKTTYKNLNYKYNEDYNFGSIRLDEVYTNKFTDWSYIIVKDSLVLYPMTTKPGLLYMKDRKTLGGCIAEGQYHNVYSLQGAWWSGAKFLHQIRPMNYYRDLDLDDSMDRVNLQSGVEGFNYHTYRNSATNWLWNETVVSLIAGKSMSTLSKGCQVTMYYIWMLVLPVIEAIAVLDKRGITYTLVNQKQIT
jgi:hypothetical protein